MPTEAPRPQRSFPRLLAVLAAAATAARLLGPAVEDRMSWVPLAQAAGLARASGRPILYHFTAEWCAPCKRLERDLFTSPREAEWLSSRYVAVRVEDREREEGRNTPEVEELQERFGVQAFPTLVAATAEGTVLARLEGYADRRKVWNALAHPPRAPAAPRRRN